MTQAGNPPQLSYTLQNKAMGYCSYMLAPERKEAVKTYFLSWPKRYN